MKKIVALTAAMLMIASSALAGTGTVNIAGGSAMTATNSSTSSTASLGKLSTNVSLTVVFDTTAFAAGTKHLSGNRGFGTSSNDTRIYYKEMAVQENSTNMSLSASDSSDFQGTGWASL